MPNFLKNLLDGGQEELIKTFLKEFPDYYILRLSTPDIRDKHKKDPNCVETEEIEKIGLFTKKGIIKKEYVGELTTIIQNFNRHFTKTRG